MKRYERQTALYAAIAFAIADLPSGTFVPMIDLPAGSVVLEGFTHISTASDAGTSDVLDIGTEASPAAYHNDLNFKSAARTAFTTLPASRATTRTQVGITRTAVGTAATVGAGVLVIGYIVEGRATENFGKLDCNPLDVGA